MDRLIAYRKKTYRGKKTARFYLKIAKGDLEFRHLIENLTANPDILEIRWGYIEWKEQQKFEKA